MSGLLGGIEGALGGVESLFGGGGGGGGGFLGELMSMIEGGGAQSQGQSGGGLGDVAKIASEALPLLALL